NRKAYEAYLKGRYSWNKLTPDGQRQALEYYEEAIREDPDYALAYVGVAECHLGRENYPKGVAAAEKALQIDQGLGEAYATLAYIDFLHEWDWLGAEEKFERAITLSPNNASGRVWHAIYLTARARHEEALAEIKRAQELDPVSHLVSVNVGVRFYYARQYDRAIKEFRKTLELYPDSDEALHNLGHVYLQTGKYEEAIAALQKAENLEGGNAHNRALLAEAYVGAGRRQNARTLLNELLRSAKQGKAHSRDIAGIYLALGEKEQALTWLDKAFEARDPYLRYVKVDPRLDPLRSDPRFQDLLRRMNFPDHAIARELRPTQQAALTHPTK
ncbi:MAG: tetratricopeptide repeat protein, partial [Acidobacteria bacterium]|nr:tetratricopeptide repeat protein [Acidobacteriota bacterium]